MIWFIPWRLWVAISAVLLLSAPAAVGVYRALEPTRGHWPSAMAALGIELTYLSLALLMLRRELRPQARAVAFAAVGTSIVLNVLADYAARVPGGLASAAAARAMFDLLAVTLAVLESAPLAGLAFALASLLHRLSEAEGQTRDTAGQVARERDALAHEVDHLAKTLDAQRATANQHVAEAARLADALAHVEAEAAHWRGMAAQAATAPALTDDRDQIEIGTQRVSLRRLAQELDKPRTTLARAVARAAQEA